MIDVRELRVTNLVECDGDIIIIEQIRLTEKGVILSLTDFTDWQFVDIKPIPLTEEWLIKKFGFEYKDIESFNILCYSRTGFDLNTYKNEEVGYYWLRHYHAPKPHRIKFVHHLQNIYFDFTGEELKPLL